MNPILLCAALLTGETVPLPQNGIEALKANNLRMQENVQQRQHISKQLRDSYDRTRDATTREFRETQQRLSRPNQPRLIPYPGPSSTYAPATTAPPAIIVAPQRPNLPQRTVRPSTAGPATCCCPGCGIPGPAGPAGPRGPQGETGATGEAGPAGSPGTPGSPGRDGEDGATGLTGPIGPQGPEGPEASIDYERLATEIAEHIYIDVKLLDYSGNETKTVRVRNRGVLKLNMHPARLARPTPQGE